MIQFACRIYLPCIVPPWDPHFVLDISSWGVTLPKGAVLLQDRPVPDNGNRACCGLEGVNPTVVAVKWGHAFDVAGSGGCWWLVWGLRTTRCVVDEDAVEELAAYCVVKPLVVPGLAHDCMLDAKWHVVADALRGWLDGL